MYPRAQVAAVHELRDEHHLRASNMHVVAGVLAHVIIHQNKYIITRYNIGVKATSQLQEFAAMHTRIKW